MKIFKSQTKTLNNAHAAHAAFFNKYYYFNTNYVINSDSLSFNISSVISTFAKYDKGYKYRLTATLAAGLFHNLYTILKNNLTLDKIVPVLKKNLTFEKIVPICICIIVALIFKNYFPNKWGWEKKNPYLFICLSFYCHIVIKFLQYWYKTWRAGEKLTWGFGSGYKPQALFMNKPSSGGGESSRHGYSNSPPNSLPKDSKGRTIHYRADMPINEIPKSLTIDKKSMVPFSSLLWRQFRKRYDYRQLENHPPNAPCRHVEDLSLCYTGIQWNTGHEGSKGAMGQYLESLRLSMDNCFLWVSVSFCRKEDPIIKANLSPKPTKAYSDYFRAAHKYLSYRELYMDKYCE